MGTARSVGKLPQGRPPDSELPNPPSDDEDSDTAEACFRLRKSRSRSKDRSKKMSARSISRDSRAISEHNYETPKLLPKSKFIKDKIPKMELIDYGYEPVGRPVTETQEEQLKIKEMKDVEARKLKQEKEEEEKR